MVGELGQCRRVTRAGMPPVKFAPSAIRDLHRLREFLRPKNPAAAQRAGQAIVKGVQVLGRPVQDMSDEFRDWVIDFGDPGYVARYRIDADAVTVLAVRHQKKVGF